MSNIHKKITKNVHLFHLAVVTTAKATRVVVSNRIRFPSRRRLTCRPAIARDIYSLSCVVVPAPSIVLSRLARYRPFVMHCNLVQYPPVLLHRAGPVPFCPVCTSFGIEVVIAPAIVRPYSPRPPSFVLFVYYTVRGSRRSSSPPPPRRLHKSHYWKPRHASRKPPPRRLESSVAPSLLRAFIVLDIVALTFTSNRNYIGSRCSTPGPTALQAHGFHGTYCYCYWC